MVINSSRATSPPVTQLITSSIASNGVSLNQQQAHKLFSENFWGEKINGFDVLCQNLKHSLISVKDLEVFLRECVNCEDTYVKNMNKLVSQTNKFSVSTNAGSFNPIWLPLKEIHEKYAGTHLQLVHQLQELIKDIQRYNEELSKRIKKIRENETQTQNLVQMFQEIHQTLNKTKDQYQSLCIEFEKQKKQLDAQQMAQYQQLSQQQSSSNLIGTNVNSSSNMPSNITSGSNLQAFINTDAIVNNNANLTTSQISSTTERLTSLATSITANKVTHVQKLEKKMKLSFEDYKTSIEKYNSIRIEFERKLVDSCNNFQYAEETHLKQMRSFIESFSKLIANVNSNKQQIYHEFQLKITEQYTTDYLIQIFIENKRTGSDRPDIAQIVEQQFDQHSAANSSHLQNTSVNSVGFIQINSPTPTLTPNLLINEIDLHHGNTSLNSTTGSSNLGVNIYSAQTTTASSNQPLNSTQSQMLQANKTSNDLIDNRGGGDRGAGTPVFFSSSNLMIGSGSASNGLYSQLTNASSSSALNTITTNGFSSLNPNSNSSANTTAASSPINIQQVPNLPVVNSLITSDVMKRSDSKGLNIFNVDFLGRNKNKEKKAAQKAAAAAAAANSPNNLLETSTNTTTLSKSKFSRGIKKKNSPASSTTSNSNGQQYENFNTTITSNSSSLFNNVGLSLTNNNNRDSSSINSEDSNEHKNINLNNDNNNKNNNNNNLSENLNDSPLISTKKSNNTEISMGVNSNLSTNNITNSSNYPTNNGNGSVTARSISSITGSLSFDLLDQLKLNGSDIDSEGYSIRPDSSIDLRRMNKNINGEPFKNKDNEDMNNLYGHSSTESDSDDSDSEGGDNSSGPLKVMLKIKPIEEANTKPQNNSDVLRQISKNLQLKPIGLQNTTQSRQQQQQLTKKRTYYYNYGTANLDQAPSGWSTSNILNSADESTNSETTKSISNSNLDKNLTRSASAGSVSSNTNSQFSNSLFGDFCLDGPSAPNNSNKATKSNANDTSIIKNESLLDLDLNFTNTSSLSTNITTNNPIPMSMSLNKVIENNLYNIDEDKEVESSFQYGQINNLIKKSSNIASSSPMNTSISNSALPQAANIVNNTLMNVSNILNSTSNNVNGNNGRFTPACFPGRTTPDFRHSASLFEQGNRASIISPLTINGTTSGSEIIPIAIAFNETIHSYFKIGDASKFKIKCFGSMKISFPFAILKLLSSELPQLEFRLKNLQIANQDLKINNQLLTNTTLFDDDLTFKFINPYLVRELKQQHQQNKQAAFFNFELLKYEFKFSESAPLVLNANWSHNKEESTVELNLDYTFNFRKNLSQVNLMIVMPITSATKVQLKKSEPTALIQENENKLQVLWQMPVLTTNGHLTAKFSVSDTKHPINFEQFYQPIYAKFHIDNETLSQLKFEIISPNYKLSLLKTKIETGKYFCNYDQTQQHTTQLSSSSSASSVPQLPQQLQKKPPFAGSLSTSIGSSADVLLNY